MNKTILWFNDMPFSVWDQISVSVTSTIILYIFILCAGYWLLNKNTTAFKLSLFALFFFSAITGYTKWKNYNQQKLIVYNVPQHQAIDFINGNAYKFIGDSVLLPDGMLQNFHLKPGRTMLQLYNKVDSLAPLYRNDNFFQFNSKKVLLIDQSILFQSPEQKMNVDYIIISKNPRIYISQLVDVFNCNQFVFDASNPLWKIAKWKKDCEQLHLRCWSVPEQGAFIADL